MNRYSKYGQSETTPELIQGDRGFTGVNMRLEPHLLPPGVCSEAVNMRFRYGVAETRLGTVRSNWHCDLSEGGKYTKWGTIYGRGRFKDPNGFQMTLLAADGRVYRCVEGNNPQEIPLPSGVTIDGPVTFLQAMNVVLMFRGFDLPNLVMRDQNTGFLECTVPDPASGAVALPNATRGVFIQNRVVVITGRDEVWASDVLDYTQGAIVNAFRINQGDSDELVNVAVLNQTTLIAFKTRSIHVLGNFYGDLNAVYQDVLTAEYGCVAAESVVQTGADLWFLSQVGVMSVKATEENKYKAVVRPQSESIQPLIDRIHWRYAAQAQGAYWNSCFYLAVPLDDAAILGPDLAGYGAVNTTTFISVPLEVGERYRLDLGMNETAFHNGAATLTSDQDFTALTADGSMDQTLAGVPVTGTVRKITRGVNTAILVFDFLNQEWAGYDEAEDLYVTSFLKAQVRGRERLHVVLASGWVMLYEEDFEDARVEPYTDLTILEQPYTLTPIVVNGGTSVNSKTTDAVNGVGAASDWGTFNLNLAQANLWMDSAFNGGYANTWTAPDTRPLRIANGVRFIGLTGVAPVVTGDQRWATIQSYTTHQIQSRMVTRAYDLQDGRQQKANSTAVKIQTWNPSLTITVQFEGVNEELPTPITDWTRSRRTLYRGSDVFVEDNQNGDALRPYRQDYSVMLGVNVAETHEIYLTNGVGLGLHQSARLVVPVEQSTENHRLEFTNEQGRLRVLGVFPEAAAKTNRNGVIA